MHADWWHVGGMYIPLQEECSLDPAASHLEAIASLQHGLQGLLARFATPPHSSRPMVGRLLQAMAELIGVLQAQVEGVTEVLQALPLCVGDAYDIGPLRWGPVNTPEDVATMVGSVLAYTEV